MWSVSKSPSPMRPEFVKAQADWVTPRPGGRGAVRDAIEEILRRQGRLDAAVAAYLESNRASEARGGSRQRGRCTGLNPRALKGQAPAFGGRR